MVYYTIREILVEAQKRFSNGDVIRYKKGRNEIVTKSYTELKEDSESLSRAILALGEEGSHIAVLGATSYEWLVSYLGIVNGGSVAVPLDAALPAEEVCDRLNRADVTMLFVDAARNDIAEKSRKLCPGLKKIVFMQQTEKNDEYDTIQQLLEKNKGAYEKKLNPDGLCTILFTSGTTGKSKGVMLSHRNLAANATCCDMKIPERTVILSVLPIHHAYCLSMDILKGLSLGSIICINDSLLHMAKNIKLFQPEMILMVPLMIETFAKKLETAKDMDKEVIKKEVFGGKLHTICSGGAYLKDSTIELFEKFGIAILQGYGMTECSPVISTMRPWDIRKTSVGQLLPNCEAKTVEGELWVKGSSVMMGYYNMPEETKATLEDGWLKTGDLGYADKDGFVYLTGRKKNLIITSNGENVSPEELENALSESRLVQEVLVKEDRGRIAAEIYPDEEYIKSEKIQDINMKIQEMLDSYNQKAPAYKRIYRLTIRTSAFEKTASGKIKRNA